jgi:hypothetical protein
MHQNTNGEKRNDELPPDHTVIVEADIEDAPKYKPRKKKKKGQVSLEEEIPPIRVQIDPMLKSLIYSRLGDDVLEGSEHSETDDVRTERIR